MNSMMDPVMSSLKKIILTPWFVVVFAILVISTFFYVDKPLAIYLHSLSFDHYQIFLKMISLFGKSALYFLLLPLLALSFHVLLKKKIWSERFGFLWACVLIPNMICVVLKITLGRARPELLFTEHLFGFYGLSMDSHFWSFPSGHTTTIVGFSLGLSYLFPRLFWGICSFAIAVILSRILLLEHYLSDVLMAAGLVLIEFAFIYNIMQRFPKLVQMCHRLRHE